MSAAPGVDGPVVDESASGIRIAVGSTTLVLVGAVARRDVANLAGRLGVHPSALGYALAALGVRACSMREATSIDMPVAALVVTLAFAVPAAPLTVTGATGQPLALLRECVDGADLVDLRP